MLKDIKLVCKRESQADDWKARMAHWDCKLSYEGRKLRIGHMEPYDRGIPTAASVLQTLFSITDESQNPLEQWYENYGKSRETRKRYETAQYLAEATKELLGKDYGSAYSMYYPDDLSADPGSYDFNLDDVKSQEDTCYRQALAAESAMRRHTSNEEVFEVAEEWQMAASTAYNAWSALRLAIQKSDHRRVATTLKTAIRQNDLMNSCRAAYDQVLSEN